MKRALSSATVYFLLLFAMGFALGTLRVLVIVPAFGLLWATLTEVPVMLIAAVFLCRWIIRRWNVPRDISSRLAMVIWFMALLFVFETVFGALLFQRTLAEQLETLTTPAGMIGLSAQFIAALLPVFMGRATHPSRG